MKSAITFRRWVTASVLLLLVGLAVTGLVLTNVPSQPAPRGRRTPLVSERLLQAARQAEPLATTREEVRYARQAVRLADKELDLAFADALRNAGQNPADATPEARELNRRVSGAQAALEAADARVADLKAQLGAAKGIRAEELRRQLELAQSEAELARDELDDARSDVWRAGADPQSRVRRQFERHQAAQHEGEAANQPAFGAIDVAEARVPANLVAQWSAWYAVRSARQQLEAAREEALAAAAALKQQHDAQDKQGGAEQASVPAASGDAAASGAGLGSLQRRAQEHKSVSLLHKRLDAAQELADVYASWTNSLQWRQTQALHGLMRCALAILLIVLAVYTLARVADHFVPDAAAERTRMRTLRGVIRFALQAFGVLVVGLVIFGIPSQISTIVGLAGAGLTVALKDFIVSFLGWFVLMGRNGIRPGDWVEINGVAGEVVEINLLRTVLLETGNWTESGHPTGRKVAFMNGYAIEGHFFNFSTSGQWLWDELKITLPAAENPYPVMESIQRLVAGETESNARAAEQEWQRAAGRYRVSQSLAASPTMYVRPAGGGVEVCVRYISRASERSATRARLYQAVFRLLHRDYSPSQTESSLAARSS